jgi:Kdo2-lipid IVA lauroyltransferase/acyltransferase
MTAGSDKSLKRRAWIFSQPAPPGWGHLMAGGKKRQQFFRFWVVDSIGNGFDLAVHFLLKCVPISVCTWVGAQLGRLITRHFHPRALSNIQENLARLRPDLSPEERAQMAVNACENQGRLMTEFSVVKRIFHAPGRVQVTGVEALKEAAASGPVILLALHLGNWELLPWILRANGLSFATYYVPPKQWGQRWIAEKTRRQSGVELLPVGQQGVRPALRRLQEGGIVSIFCDEGFAGEVRGPLFGKTPHLQGNFALAARLAHHANASLCIFHAARVNGQARFDCHFLAPFKLPFKENRITIDALLNDVELLNSRVEPIVSAHLDQWYFLDNRL